MSAGSLIVRAAVHVLPAGAVRQRYRREFLGELTTCTRAAQLRFALGVLSTVVALRAALVGSQLLVSPVDPPAFPGRRPLLCRLRLHHWTTCHNPDGESYLRCRRCGIDHYELQRHYDPENVAANIFGSNFNGGSF
jgi:hypothetical protein